MTPEQVISTAKAKLDSAKNHFQEELKKLRTGRAHPSMLDGITAEAYGTPMPLLQLATITTPEPQLIQVSPFDPNNLEAIAEAIRKDQSLGMNPTDDGKVIRVPIPPLTTERRSGIVKQLGEKVEECMIAMRNARHEAMKELDQAKKDKDIGEDDHKRYAKQLDEAMAKVKENVESIAKTKESEIMTI
jgi:ribosome recycling factor